MKAQLIHMPAAGAVRKAGPAAFLYIPENDRNGMDFPVQDLFC